MLALLSAQSVQERDLKSAAIQAKLLGMRAFQSAGAVCFYVALPTEVDTHPMIEASLKLGKKVLVPLVDLENKELKLKEIRDFRKDLAPGALGILEPGPHTRSCAPSEPECYLVPALAFDEKGYRLGRGGGFYDRLLSSLTPETATIGLAFSFQVLPAVPLEPHDRAVQTILTEEGPWKLS